MKRVDRVRPLGGYVARVVAPVVTEQTSDRILAFPIPMLFCSGGRDGLFPVDNLERTYARMCAIWKSQEADYRLVSRLWDVAHEFNVEMQNTAFI